MWCNYSKKFETLLLTEGPQVDPEVNYRKFPREMREDPLALSSRSLLFCGLFFVRCAQSTEKILFNSHSFFTSFLHASLPPVSPGTSSRPNRTPAFFIPSSLPLPPHGRSRRRSRRSSMNYLFAKIFGINTLEFRWISSIFHASPGRSFLLRTLSTYATCLARERRLGFHGCLRWAAEKNVGDRQNAFSVKSCIIGFAAA